jgi:CIC family chloride channel protein
MSRDNTVSDNGNGIHAKLTDWLRRIRVVGSGFEGQRYLAKWLFLSTAIGIVAGIGALAFYWAIDFCTEFFLGSLVGYKPPSPVGEGTTTIIEAARPWVIPLVTTIGGLISGIIVFKLAPEAEGHGTDAAIESIHSKGGVIRPRIPLVKLVASAITIGSGGSGGREGPAAQISAGFGSLLGKWLHLDARSRRIAVAAGIGAGIGAIFKAPLGGALLSAEILYVHDLETDALIPGLIASIVGYSVFGAFSTYEPIFGARPDISFDQPVQLVYYAILGVICGLFGILYAKSFYGTHKIFQKIKMPRWLKPALGGLLVGLIGLKMPECLHMGYGWVQLAMDAKLETLTLGIILALPFVKILSTSLSISSGGSGGIFGPGMVIGGMLGAAFWHLGAGLPNMPPSPAPFVIIGMIGMFGGIAHAPLAVMLMVAEMTGNLSLLAPAMIVVAISTAIVGENTIYRSQLPDRASSPAHRVRMSFPLLSSLLVRDAISNCTTLPGSLPISTAKPYFVRDPAALLVYLDDEGKFGGVATARQLHKVSPDKAGSTPISKLDDKEAVILHANEPMDAALEQLTTRGLSWAPVVESGRLMGRLTVRDAIATYRNTMERSIRRTTELPGDTAVFEARLSPSSPVVGKLLREAHFPADTLVVSIVRKSNTIFPHADTKLEAGDIIVVMADPASEGSLHSFLGTIESFSEVKPKKKKKAADPEA